MSAPFSQPGTRLWYSWYHMIPVLLFLLVAACSDDDPSGPGKPVDPFAGCGNGDPISTDDSLARQWPMPAVSITLLKVNPVNGWWAAKYTRNTEPKTRGVFVYDPANAMLIASYKDAWAHEWSPDGTKLLLDKEATVFVIDFPSGNMRQLTDRTEGGVAWVSWFGNGDFILYSQITQAPSGTFIMNTNGQNKRKVTEALSASAFDSIRFFYVSNHNLVIVNAADNSGGLIYMPEMDMQHSPELISVSPSRDRLLFESHDDGDALDPWANGVWIVDTTTWKPRKILDGQWWDHTYYPTWASQSTFYASVFCRNDSSSMVWEFDLNGNPLRQVTNKYMNVWME